MSEHGSEHPRFRKPERYEAKGDGRDENHRRGHLHEPGASAKRDTKHCRRHDCNRDK